jgi:hypothetical protein
MLRMNEQARQRDPRTLDLHGRGRWERFTLATLLWLCLLPLIALGLVPIAGPLVAGLTAAALLPGLLVLCNRLFATPLEPGDLRSTGETEKQPTAPAFTQSTELPHPSFTTDGHHRG